MNPEFLPRPPRRVRGRLGGGIWFARIFMMPHTLIGIGAAGYLVFLLLWRLLGSDIPGTVVGSKISHSSKHGDSYVLNYQFQAGGQTKSSSDGVSLALYQRYQNRNETNPPVTVHYFSIGPLEHSALHTGSSLWGEIGALTLWASFWNLIISIFLYQYWVKPLRARMLYRNGEATAGTLLRKRVQKGKTSTYYVSYKFNDPFSGKVFESEIQVWNPAEWHLAMEGQPVTVLYSRDNPKRSTVYEFGGYRVEGE